MARCKLEGCPVAVDGRCLENLGGKCPNLLAEDEPLTSEAPLPISQTTDLLSVPAALEALPPATPLEVTQARKYSQRGSARVVSFIGMQDCGKTSLLARIHQLFQAGPIGTHSFAGSASLPRFEEMNWLSAVKSGNGRPDMQRSSSRFDNAFLHLSVQCGKSQTRTELLFNDVSGETFGRAVVSQTVCDALTVLGRADHVVLLVDGSQMNDNRRHHHLSQVSDFVQRAIQAEHFHRMTTFHIVTSKMDSLADGRLPMVEQAELGLRRRLEHVCQRVYTWRIAARPMDGTLPTVEPIVEMFSIWTTPQIHPRIEMVLLPPRSGRPICRFGARAPQ